MNARTLAFSLSLASSLFFLADRAPADANCRTADEAEAAAPAVFANNHQLSAIPLPSTDGGTRTLADILGKNDYLVVTFFSSTCPCQTAHDGRLKDLYTQWHERGVAFVAVDSEADSSLSTDITEAKRRGYPFPILSDPEGKLADALGARFATYTVILDKKGNIRYRGGIDSDRTRLTDKARHYVRTALAQLLAGQDPNPAETKALGCLLTKR